MMCGSAMCTHHGNLSIRQIKVQAGDGLMVETVVLRVDPEYPDSHAISLAAQAVAAGRLVAFPTETVYGLGANALDEAAVDRIFVAKRRPHSDPLIVHVASPNQVADIARDVPPAALRVGAAFWPGPLTLVLRRGERTAANVSGGRDTVAVRIPDHPIAQALLVASGLPIAAPSANLFSRPSPTTAQHVLDDLDGRVDIVLDGGPTTIGLESTVIDMTQDPPRLLRPGGASAEALLKLLPDLLVARSAMVLPDDEMASSPGMLLKHYSPKSRVLLLAGSALAAAAVAAQIVALLRRHGMHVGVLATDEESPAYTMLPVEFVSLGSIRDLDTAGRLLFAHLRRLEAHNVDVILARTVPMAGVGLAISDRLFRAAEGQVIDTDNPRAVEQALAMLESALVSAASS
jgi:L-threonylcarbamoyladenylate synthase